ncbi:unnamed protein product, partial [Acidithrix sp. C25]
VFRGILWFETKRMARNFVPVFFALVFPVMMLSIFGGIYGSTPSARFGGRGVVDSSVPAYLVLVISVTGLMSFPLGLGEYRERGVLKRFSSTPARSSSFLLAQGIVNLVLTIGGVILLVLTGLIFFGLHLPKNIVTTIFALILVMLGVYSVGALIAALARTERQAIVIANLVYFPVIFLSGVTIPLAIFPSIMIKISDFIPFTYGVKLLQSQWLGTSTNLGVDLSVISATILLGAFVAIRAFRWE